LYRRTLRTTSEHPAGSPDREGSYAGRRVEERDDSLLL
jgi:hypothetical protein